MKFRIKSVLLGFLLLVIGGILCWLVFNQRSPEVGQTSRVAEVNPGELSAAQADTQQQFRDAYLSPIDFWGKVEDTEGNPVGNAEITLRAATGPFSSNGTSSIFELESGRDGLFEFSGISGTSLGVKVTKPGYDQVFSREVGAPSSKRQFNYFDQNVTQIVAPPTERNPAIFVLRKKLDAETINRGERIRYSLPIDGTPLLVSLRGGGEDVSFVCVASPDKRYGEGRNAPFDWNCKISVPEGGLQLWIDHNQVLAPEEGYLESVSVEMPGSMPPNDWRWSARDLRYWVKLADGTHARIKVKIDVGRKNLIYIDSWHNPSGSRNLEHDPSRENPL